MGISLKPIATVVYKGGFPLSHGEPPSGMLTCTAPNAVRCTLAPGASVGECREGQGEGLLSVQLFPEKLWQGKRRLMNIRVDVIIHSGRQWGFQSIFPGYI